MRIILKLIFIGIVITLARNHPCYCQGNNRASDRKEWVKEMTREYSPDSWDLLMEYESLPERLEADAVDGNIARTEKTAGTFYYLDGRTKSELLLSMATNVHEIAHAYCGLNVFRYASGKGLKLDIHKAEEFFYYSPSRSFYVSFPMKSLFPSGELKAFIPVNMRTFRFDTYIDGTTSTQSEGIIGLLNELHSYYLESKFCYEVLEPYKIAEGTDASGLFEWVHNSQSKMSAFFEFDYFIREYLLYMKRKYPVQYKALSNYRPFTEAYGAILKSYRELTENYLRKIKDEISKLNRSGKAVASLDGSELWVREGNSKTSVGTSVFSDDREKLLPVLQSGRYREIIDDFPGIH